MKGLQLAGLAVVFIVVAACLIASALLGDADDWDDDRGKGE